MILILQQVLTDPSLRDGSDLETAAASEPNEFSPWSQ